MRLFKSTLGLLVLTTVLNLHAQDYLGKYHEIYDSKEGKSAVMKNGLWGFINEKGEEIIALKYENVGDFNEGLTFFEKNKLRGYIDATGREVIPAQYNLAHPFKNGKAIVAKDNLYGVIDKSGKIVIPLQYTSIIESDNYFVVNQNKKAGILNTQGKTVVPIQYIAVRGPQSGVFMAANDSNLYAMLSIDGKPLTPFKYNFVGWTPKDGLWYVQSAYNKHGYLDLKGNEVISTDIYSYVNSIPKDINFILARKTTESGKEKYGVIDKTGKTVIPFDFNSLNEPSEGLLAAGFENNKFGFIDMKGKTVIQPVYDIAHSFVNGRAHVGNFKPGADDLLTAFLNNEFLNGAIDRSGKVIVPLIYDDLLVTSSDYIAFNQGKSIQSNYNIYTLTSLYYGSPGKWGLLDKNGKVVVKPMFTNISKTRNGYFSVNIGATIANDFGNVIGGKWGLIDSLGIENIPAISDRILYINDKGLTYVESGQERKMIDVLAQTYISNGLKAAQINNYTDAHNWFEKASKRGNGTGYGNLGFLYLQGMGVPKDETKAVQLLKQGAERDDAQSMFNLGWYYASQKQDKDEAIKWLLQAEKAGHPQARPMLQQLANVNINNTPATDSREERMRERQRDN